ncbi:alpha/beta hydrolase [Microlunatus panaciterrae]|uniref:Pimeloyl-ACP methyl ester carboxylesterase n=1 Tax=Microlunatus panaciterrae TaxID=400768 RepID=A0ABS2RGP3_9ACTN|nr:alpha/beta fold hydrolase [Microlunatus panaciterrae]MBM7797853.1 pimeloyl-ACP methyl ester carboxylesterase [Microlunatus panaciterrae]
MITSPYAAALDALGGRRRVSRVAGSATAYWVYGEQTAKPPLVVVHGFRGDHHGLEPIVAQLAGRQVIAPDLPGFGESSPFTDRRHDVDGYAGWLVDFVAQVTPGGRTILLGHSFGSVVVAAALSRGLAAHRAIMVNPIAAPALAGPRGVLTRLTAGYYRLGAALPERLGLGLLANRGIVRGLSMVMAKTPDRERRRWIHDQHHRYFSRFANRQVVLEAFRAATGTDVSQYASTIPVPVLLIGADRDDVTAPAAQYHLVSLFPNAELIMIPRVGHLIHYEAPERAAAAILAFTGPQRHADNPAPPSPDGSG